jgi:putative aminopeptidase FrvX
MMFPSYLVVSWCVGVGKLDEILTVPRDITQNGKLASTTIGVVSGEFVGIQRCQGGGGVQEFRGVGLGIQGGRWAWGI